MSEQNVVYAEMKQPNPSQKQKRQQIYLKKEDSLFSPWQLLAGTLGVLSLGLMATVLALGNLMAKQPPNQESERISSVPNTTSQRECYPASCPENWIWDRNSCYYISKESRSWKDSQMDCKNKNSCLLKIDDREELENFLKHLKSYYWIGLIHNGPTESWLWEDGTALCPDLSSKIERFPRSKCVYYGLENEFLHENCSSSVFYICEQSTSYSSDEKHKC
ncbi:natural killer cells antigen CD94-like [Tachyglossus aculeatus]|uniref:natural killer cells antigen CD94-like n=1 Tax=Tachyglossus aculeatus TaxID=9261 RepID=UPI0018F56F5F|nr:natural killer cells antigen CD94-like [Tachyglossus aculeatus]